MFVEKFDTKPDGTLRSGCDGSWTNIMGRLRRQMWECELIMLDCGEMPIAFILISDPARVWYKNQNGVEHNTDLLYYYGTSEEAEKIQAHGHQSFSHRTEARS